MKICKKKLPADKNNEIRSACCPPCLHICQAFSVYFLQVLQFNKINIKKIGEICKLNPPHSVSVMQPA
jgi:hypothetical protein